jgi:formylglycine-generating enzyme required for sulfatase activity
MSSVFSERIGRLLVINVLALVTLKVAAQELPGLQIQRVPPSGFRVSFPSSDALRYQLFTSSDLKLWTPFGEQVQGNNQLVHTPVNIAQQTSAFFKLISTPTAQPAPLSVRWFTNKYLQFTFASITGQQYQAYASSDLVRWNPLADVFIGTGKPLSFEFDPSFESPLFFRVYAVTVKPMTNMVAIPAGTFTMGSARNEKDRDLDEDPLTLVTFVRGFWMSKYEVTQREYLRVMGTNPSFFPGDLDRPVEEVSWLDAVAYCEKLTLIEKASGRIPVGYSYRLPTEAEFEYAYRARSSDRFFYGDDQKYEQLGEYAWYDENSGQASHPVGQKKPNAFGLYDMAGNVWEWCLDWYGSAYPGGSVFHPTGPKIGLSRVFRGGGYDYIASSCRAAFRNHVSPTRTAPYIGFRVVLSGGL